jgi:predicted Rossmann fold flavoprotein
MAAADLSHAHADLTRRGTDIAHPRVVIVGAGAAGIAAAIFIRRLNPSCQVRLLDGAARPGAKILVSGGSRCNVTNAAVSERDFAGGKSTIVRRVLRAFPAAETVAWFASLGVPLHEEEHGKLFPDSHRSRDVLDALMREIQACGAILQASTRVTAITRNIGASSGDAGLTIPESRIPSPESRVSPSFSLRTHDQTLEADVVVLATGGQSLPKTGSDGAGLVMARHLGHSIVPTTPALVPLLAGANGSAGASVQGVAHDVDLSVWIDGALSTRLTGALLWTHFGVSGPVVLNASRHWLRAQLDGRAVRVTINMCPGERFETLDARWTSAAATRPRASLQTALAEVLPASVAAAVLERLQLDASTPLAHLARPDRRRLAHALAESPLLVTGSRGYNYAEATAGGVALDEINPSTMESRRCPGLYLVGEMLDVDGRIGGYNFQWAWSSARVAARAIAASPQGQVHPVAMRL